MHGKKMRNRMENINIPEDKYICKHCWHCECNKETTGTAICSVDIGDKVDVNDGCCEEFEYDSDFERY